MKFTKMHGLGNDYVYVNCFEEKVENPAKTARYVSDRHRGIGSDGLIMICPSDKADFEMVMYNADGSRAEMCGNGIRCVGKYVYDYGLTDQTSVTVDTLAGVKNLELTVEDGKVSLVKVDMGSPELTPEKVPVLPEKMTAECVIAGGQEDVPGGREQIVDCPLEVGGNVYGATCVSMGNPHVVVYVDDVDGLDIESIGPKFEHHPCFPQRVNTEFVRVLDRHTAQMRVWERGTGETQACGTGACAVAVSCILNGLTEEDVTVRLPGGDLQISWDRKADKVYMTGPAVTVFDGEIM